VLTDGKERGGGNIQAASPKQNKALEQTNRTLAAKALNAAKDKIDKASFYQLVFGAANMFLVRRI